MDNTEYICDGMCAECGLQPTCSQEKQDKVAEVRAKFAKFVQAVNEQTEALHNVVPIPKDIRVN